MKKLLLVAAVAAFSAVNAQMQRGSWVISGSTNLGGNFSNTTYKSGNVSETDGDTFKINFTPSFGVFVADNLAVGADISLRNERYDYGGTDGFDNEFTFSFMPTGTYYFYNEGIVIPFVGVGAGYTHRSFTEDIGTMTYSDQIDGFSWKAKTGIAILITPQIAGDVSLGYQQNHFTDNDGYGDYDIIERNLGVNLGLSVFLGKKRKKSTDSN